VYAFHYPDGLEHLDALLAELDDACKTMAALVADVRAAVDVADDEFSAVRSWHDLHSELPLTHQGVALRWGHHRRETTRRFCRELKRITEAASTGLFVGPDAQVTSLRSALADLEPGDVFVVDVAPLTPEEQTFVVCVVMREIKRLRLDGSRPGFPRHILVFLDELSKFAPRTGRHSPLREYLADVAQRGRSIGLSLLGCEQGLTSVDRRIVDNASTRIFGRTHSGELTDGAYRSLPPRVRALLPHLRPGRLVIEHAPIPAHLTIAFPRPAHCTP